MKFKKLIVLSAAAVLLFGLAIVKQNTGGPPSVTLDSPSERTSVGNKFEVSGAAHLDIYLGKGEGERVSLAKDASGHWTITSRFGTRARKEGIENLLNHLADIRGELRSDSPNLLVDYSITDDKGFHLEVSDATGRKLAHRIVSPMRPRGTQNFAREAGSDRVIVTYTDVLSDINIFSDQDKLSDKTFEDLSPAPNTESSSKKS